MNKNYMTLRNAKILALSVGVYFLVSFIVLGLASFIDQEKHPDLYFQSVLLIKAANMVFLGSVGLTASYVILNLFFKNTFSKFLKEKTLDEAFSGLTPTQKTRWFLIAIGVGFLGFSNFAQAKTYTRDILPISQKGVDLIVKYEIGSESYYTRHLSRLTVPAVKTTWSGATAGIGYDFGHTSQSQIKRDWQGKVSPLVLNEFMKLSGKKKWTAYNAIKSLKHIKVPLSTAKEVFAESTLPRFATLTKRAFALEDDTLHPHCNGALVSTGFNRGLSMKGDRRREMRWIKYNIHNNLLHRVPGDFRSMKRLWSYTKLRGLHRRYDATADLFQSGIDEMKRSR